MIRLLALIAGLSASSALKVPSRDAVDAAFRERKSEVASYTYEPVALPAAALLDPFVDASRELTRFKTPYVKVTKTGGEETYRYDREPSSAEDALALLELDNLSYVLKYELLELDEWPEALAALVPPNLIDTLTEDPYAGGTTVHAYLSAPGAVALPAHEDLGNVLVLQLLGEKTWSIDGRDDDVTLKPGDALWIPQGVSHSAVAQSTLSGHVTIHGITPEHVAKHEARRQLHHVTGDDGTIDDQIVFRPDSCSIWDAGCTGGRWGRCTCNLCHGCSDAGAFCAFEPSDVTMHDPCCKPGDDDGCDPYYHDDDGPGPYPHDAPRDAEGWVVISKPDKGCDWVAEKPSKRCSEKGVLIHRESHYGLEWLLENQPRWTAKEACPVTCGTVCGDDASWTYTIPTPPSCSGRNICGCDDKSFCDFDGTGEKLVGVLRPARYWDSCEKCPKTVEKCAKKWRDEAAEVDCKNCCFDADLPTDDNGVRDCIHVAMKPEKRCVRMGDDGRRAREACPLACADFGGDCGKLPLATPRPTGKPTFRPTKAPFTADTWKATDEDIQQAVNDWRKRRDEALEKYGPISDWDVSQVTNMRGLFWKFSKFNDDISAWDTSGVTDMALMFEGLKTTIDISKWQTGKVKSMERMFESSKFQGDISRWDVSRVASFKDMFNFADFNGDISKWDVSMGKDFSSMFRGAERFNQDLSAWTFGDQVFELSTMFSGSYGSPSSFDQDLGWCFPKPMRDYGIPNEGFSPYLSTPCEKRACGIKFECRTGTRLDVTAADARGAGAFSTLLLVGALLVIAAFIMARKATRSAEARPLLATTA